MAGEWGISDMRARIAELQELIKRVGLQDGDGLALVGEELRLDIASLPIAPEN